MKIVNFDEITKYQTFYVKRVIWAEILTWNACKI